MKSDGAVVRTSNGMPPAARIASLTTRATPSRCAKHTASSEEELTTAIFGLAMSASDRPSVRQCARRMAELAARLRRVVMGFSGCGSVFEIVSDSLLQRCHADRVHAAAAGQRER